MNELRDARDKATSAVLDMYSAIIVETLLGELEGARKWAIYYKKKYEDAQANHDLWVEDVFYKENDE